MDPIGGVPILLAVTRTLERGERHRAAAVASAMTRLVIAPFAIAVRMIADSVLTFADQASCRAPASGSVARSRTGCLAHCRP